MSSTWIEEIFLFPFVQNPSLFYTIPSSVVKKNCHIDSGRYKVFVISVQGKWEIQPNFGHIHDVKFLS